MAADETAHGRSSGKKRLALLAPFLLICAFAALAFCRISGQENGGSDEIPNALQGKLAPRLRLPLLAAAEGGSAQAIAAQAVFDSAALRGKVTLVNFWGSWCAPCRQEHPFLMRLAQESRSSGAFQLVGVNYKDSSENALRFLGSFGNPFRQIGFDGTGRAAIDWGVYGPPETFLLDKQGRILYRFVGPMDEAAFRAKLWPLIGHANQS